MHEIMCRRTFGDVQLRLRFELADIPEAGVTYVCMNGWLSVDPVPYVRTFRAAPCHKATWRRFKGDTGNYHEGGNELFVTRGCPNQNILNAQGPACRIPKSIGSPKNACKKELSMFIPVDY